MVMLRRLIDIVRPRIRRLHFFMSYIRRALIMARCLIDAPRRVCELERSTQALAELLGEAEAARARVSAGERVESLISVIMPTRERADRLSAAMESVRRQSYPNWELLVVDDASQDPTEAVVAGLALADERIRYLRMPGAGGVSAARNAALREARGEIVVYLDDDNVFYPNYLRAVAEAYADDPRLLCAYAAQLWVESPQRVMVTFDRYSWDDLWDRKINIDMNVFSHRKSLVEHLGGHDEHLRRHGDWDLILRYAAHASPRRLPVMAVRYDWGKRRRISNSEASAIAERRIREKWPVKPWPRQLRVLVLVHDYPQLSESYVHVEIEWLRRQGVHVEVLAQAMPVSPGRASVPVHRGDLAGCVVRTRPDILHVHWMSLARYHGADLEKFGIPVTIRAHGFDYSDDLAANLLARPWLACLYLFPNLIPAPLRAHPKLRAMPVAVDASRYDLPTGAKDRRLVLRAGACLPTKDLGLFFKVAALRPEYRFKLVLSTNASGYRTDDELRRLNESLGQPVEILRDLQYDAMAELMREAGVYLHTFGFEQPFGQPISVMEAMACGAVPLIRRSESSCAYGGDAALYYDSARQAADILGVMLDWTEAQWQARASACLARARGHADAVVLRPMLEDWRRLAGASGSFMPGEPD